MAFDRLEEAEKAFGAKGLATEFLAWFEGPVCAVRIVVQLTGQIGQSNRRRLAP